MKYLSKLLSILLCGLMLCTVGCADYDEDIRDLNNKIDNIQNSLMDDQISPLKTDFEAIKTQLEELISDTETLTATHKADLATLTKANEDLAKRIKSLEDADYAQSIADAIAEFNEAVSRLETQDNAFKTQLADIEAGIAANAGDITKVNEALAEYQVVVNAKIYELEARIAVVEDSLKNIEQTLIPAMQSQIDQNSSDIQSILGALTLLSVADQTVFDLIYALEGNVDERILALNNTLTTQFNECWSEILRVESEMNAKMNAQMLEIEALRKAINTVGGDLAYLQASVDAKYDELSKNVAAVKSHLEDYKKAVTKEIEAAVEAAAEQVIETLTIDITALQNKLSDLNAKYNNLVADFDSFKDEINNRLTSIEEDLEAINNKLAAMVQNITFVPEYTDGLATAVRVVGPQSSTLSATTLTAVFEITPASAASVIAKNGCVAVEPLKTRAEILRGERLAVEVVDAEAGRVKVTAFVHNMPADYNSYAFTLNVEVENETVASSDYVYIHENNDAEFEYALVTEKGNEPIQKHANWNAERKALVFENKWTNAAEEAVNALEGYVYKLTNGEDFYTLAEVESKYGMAEGALAVNFEAEISDAHAEFVTTTSDAVIDMKYDNEYQMYEFINAEAEINYYADNAAFLNDTFKVYYKVTGVDVVDDAFIIEEEGDLYWLSQNQDYVFGQKKAKRVVFAEKLNLDMAGYCDAAVLAPYKAISPITVVSIEGNNSLIKNLAVNGVESVGLFGYVKGSIADLTVVESNFEGNHWVGAIAGRICGSIKNCHVDGVNIVATPNIVNGAYDNGDKVGGIVGYSEPNSANTPAEPIENCSVRNANITAFRDAAGIVGAMYYGDNLKNNVVENVNILAIQRDFLTPGYYKTANIGRVIGRDLMGAWVESDLASNNAANTDVRIRYAIGAEVNLNSVDAKDYTLEISTANGLAWFSNHVTDANYYTYENVKFVADIDFNGVLKFADDAVEFKPINNWVGTKYRLFNFDGNNKTIYNFVYDAEKKDIGLFGSFVGNVKNVKMENVVLCGQGRVAPIATQIWGSVDNCHVKNLRISVHQNAEDGDKLGGIVAQMQDANTITNCSVTDADIEGYRDLGALAGHANLASYDDSNKFSNVVVWVNQTYNDYEKVCVPFENEGEVVGRKTGVVTPEDVEGVEIYNILYADLNRRYVVTPKNQLRLGYEKCNVKENTAALWKFAEEYKQYDDVFQVTEMELDTIWTPIGTSANPFKGTYNGNGKSIKGLNIVDTATTPSGFFGFARGTISNVNIVSPTIYGSHYAGAVVAHMFGSVMNCNVSGGEIIILPNYENGRFDNGDKAGALVGYLADTGVGGDKILNNTVDGVKIKAYRDVAALVGCASNIDAMSGNTVKNCHVIVDQITCKYPASDVKAANIGMFIGRLVSNNTSKIENNTIVNSTLSQVVEINEQFITEMIDVVEIGSIGK